MRAGPAASNVQQHVKQLEAASDEVSMYSKMNFKDKKDIGFLFWQILRGHHQQYHGNSFLFLIPDLLLTVESKKTDLYFLVPVGLEGVLCKFCNHITVRMHS